MLKARGRNYTPYSRSHLEFNYKIQIRQVNSKRTQRVKTPWGRLVSHHYTITTGHSLNDLAAISKVFGIECETL